VGEGIHSTVRSFDLDFEHETVAGAGPGGEDFELRMVATSTVPLGGGSWNWIAGGEVTLYSVPGPGVLAVFGLCGLAGGRRRRA
jgi:MYXO-CTERM domain-containing protein